MCDITKESGHLEILEGNIFGVCLIIQKDVGMHTAF